MNKREKRLLAIYNKRMNEPITEFTTDQLIRRVKEQDYCYTEAMRRTDKYFMAKMIVNGVKL